MSWAGKVSRCSLRSAKRTVAAKAQEAPVRIGFLGPRRSSSWPEKGAMQAPTAQPRRRTEPASVSPVPHNELGVVGKQERQAEHRELEAHEGYDLEAERLRREDGKVDQGTLGVTLMLHEEGKER